jgi:7-cyano-7-deazaguanine synthase in queuosine biosynthesis
MDINDLSNSVITKGDKHKTKIEKYVNERKEIMDKLFEIINVQTENGVKFFYADDITEEKQKEIIDMKDKIKRYFIVSGWITYKNTVKLDKVHMSLVRNLLKHENINYTLTTKMFNGVKKTKYILLDNSISNNEV